MKLDTQHFCYIVIVMYKLFELHLVLKVTLYLDTIELLCHGPFQIPPNSSLTNHPAIHQYVVRVTNIL
jgi:hypothetical protein